MYYQDVIKTARDYVTRSPEGQLTDRLNCISPVQLSGYERLEEVSCRIHSLKENIFKLTELLRRPPRIPDEQHISLPLSVWNCVVELATLASAKANDFEEDLSELVKEAWDDKEKLVTKKREVETAVAHAQQQQKEIKSKFRRKHEEQREREVKLIQKESVLHQNFNTLSSLWEEQTQQIKQSLGVFQDRMDHHLHDDWQQWLDSFKKEAVTRSQEYQQDMMLSPRPLLEKMPEIVLTQAGTPPRKLLQIPKQQGEFLNPNLEAGNRGDVTTHKKENEEAEGTNIRNTPGAPVCTQKRSLSYISEGIKGGLDESCISESSVQVFNRAANGMELEPEWDQGLEEEVESESGSHISQLEQLKGQFEGSQLPSYLQQVMHLVKDKQQLLKYLQNVATPPRIYQHPEVGIIDSGSKRRKQSQSEMHTPLMPVNMRGQLEHTASVMSGSHEQDPRDWIKDEQNEMMDMIKTATDEALVKKLEEVEINDGAKIMSIVERRARQHQQSEASEGTYSALLNHSVERPPREERTKERRAAQNMEEGDIRRVIDKRRNSGSRGGETKLTLLSRQSSGGRISSARRSTSARGESQVEKEEFESTEEYKPGLQNVEVVLDNGAWRREESTAKIQYASRQPSLEMSQQQAQAFSKGYRHNAHISITESYASGQCESVSSQSRAINIVDQNSTIQGTGEISSQSSDQNSQRLNFLNVADNQELISETGSPDTYVMKEQCLPPQHSLEVIQENQSEFSNTQSILDSANRPRRLKKHKQRHDSKAELSQEVRLSFPSRLRKSDFEVRSYAPNNSQKLDGLGEPGEGHSRSVMSRVDSDAAESARSRHQEIQELDVQLKPPLRILRSIPYSSSVKNCAVAQQYGLGCSSQNYKSQGEVSSSSQTAYNSQEKNGTNTTASESTSCSSVLKPPNNNVPQATISRGWGIKDQPRGSVLQRGAAGAQILSGQGGFGLESASSSIRTPTTRISFKRSSIKNPAKSLKRPRVIFPAFQKEVSQRSLNESGGMSPKARAKMFQTLMTNTSSSNPFAVGAGVYHSNLTGQQSILKNNILYSVVEPYKGAQPMLAVVKRTFSDNGLTEGSSRLCDALGLAMPPREEATIWEEHALDLNLYNTGLCFLSGEQEVQHLVELEAKESTEDGRRTGKQQGKIIRLNSGMFVSAAGQRKQPTMGRAEGGSRTIKWN